VDQVQNTVVDASDSFFGEGNNGRDCIQNATTYDYDLTNCFFQNNQKAYSTNDYLLGQIVTTGIARYNDRFNFAVTPYITSYSGQPFSSYQFSLSPVASAEFSTTLNLDNGYTCPSISCLGGQLSCTCSIFYNGPETVSYGQSTSKTLTAVSFTSSNTTQITINPSASRYVFYVGGNFQCSFFVCSPGSGVSYVTVTSYSTQIVSATDVALDENVYSTANSSVAYTVNLFTAIATNTGYIQANLSLIAAQLGPLNFNETELVPYANFSALRAQVNALIQNIQPSGSQACASGVFGSVACWFQDAASTLIVLAIVVAIGIGCYCLFVKFGLCNKICSKGADF